MKESEIKLSRISKWSFQRFLYKIFGEWDGIRIGNIKIYYNLFGKELKTDSHGFGYSKEYSAKAYKRFFIGYLNILIWRNKK